MTYKIGIFGSAVNTNQSTINQARILGRTLGQRRDVIIITGACSGIPYQVALAAHSVRSATPIWGYSPVTTLKAQKDFTPHDDLSLYTKLIFTPKTFPFSSHLAVSKKYRNVISTATCDGGIIIAGRWGTLNEFTNLIDMGKVIGVLTGTGGITAYLPSLVRNIKKEGTGKVIFSRQPKTLVNRLIHELSS